MNYSGISREVINMTRITFLLITLLLAGLVQSAQLYRWVDDKGRVEWRDTPPPANAKKVEQRNVQGSVIQTTLPYSLQQAVQNYPVTLYANDCGDACTKARAHLTRRGVPFTQKNPENDVEGYKKLTNGGMEIPMLFVGKDRLKGYLESSWDSALDTAGYLREPAPGYAAPKPPTKAPAPVTAPVPATAAPQNAAPAAAQ
jgi:hypothetical protein